jgi:CRP-like cAMP-binding protein
MEKSEQTKAVSTRPASLSAGNRFSALMNEGDVVSFPAGATMCAEGDTSQGVLLILAGSAELSVAVGKGDAMKVGKLEAGDIAGLSEAISGRPYELTMTALEPCTAVSVDRQRFLAFLLRNTSVCFEVMKSMSSGLADTYRQARLLLTRANVPT